MTNVQQNIAALKEQLPKEVSLVAVSKTKPTAMILEAYDGGHRSFGENKVQELVEKYEALPKDIEWHLIGHLQTNKVKYIAGFVQLIHGVDRPKVLAEINKRAAQHHRVIDCLLQIHIAKEESKFGFDAAEVRSFLASDAFAQMQHVRIRGLMGMATFTDDEEQVRAEFAGLKALFDEIKVQFFADSEQFNTLSMGMSGDYPIAIAEGSNMIRVGSALFGSRAAKTT